MRSVTGRRKCGFECRKLGAVGIHRVQPDDIDIGQGLPDRADQRGSDLIACRFARTQGRTGDHRVRIYKQVENPRFQEGCATAPGNQQGPRGACVGPL